MTFVQSLLWPFSLVFSAGARFRAWSFRAGLRRAKRLDATVISLGNLTVGGTGKTPMVCWLAAQAAAERKQVAILIRGYRGSQGFSDEVEVLRSRLGDTVRIGVGADRYAKGMELKSAGFNWFILDDGFQHLQLARDVDILLIDATSPFGGGHLLPAGRLREPVSALRRADIIVISRSIHAPAVEAVVRRYTQAPAFYAQTKLDGIFALCKSAQELTRSGKPNRASDTTFFAFCGIGNPRAFLADLERWKIHVTGSMEFPDHHRYTQQDVDAIQRRARAASAEALLCTEKDLANLRDARTDDFHLFYCKISLEINEPREFWEAVKELAAKKRAETAS